MKPSITLLSESFPGRPALDTAVSHAVLRRVGSREQSETLRLHRADEWVAFSVLDTRRPGFPAAVDRARAAGFGAALRLAGGHAALFHRESIAFAWAMPIDDPRTGIQQRFEAVADRIAKALQHLGVDARVGEVDGEYCPGEHSVNARGRRKLMGVGQRVVRGAAHVGGVIVVRDSSRLRRVLKPVYESLELPFEAETAGAVEDEVPGVTLEDVRAALLAEIARDAELVPAELDARLLEAASDLEAWHQPDRSAGRRTAPAPAGSPAPAP